MQPKIKNWDEAELEVKEVAEIDRTLNLLEKDMNADLEKIQAKATNDAAPLQSRRAEIVARLEAFANTQPETFSKKKTKPMSYGQIGYRKQNIIIFDKTKEKSIIEKIKKLNMSECIDAKETINKKKLGKYSDAVVVKVGAKRQTGEKFFCKTNMEVLVNNDK